MNTPTPAPRAGATSVLKNARPGDIFHIRWTKHSDPKQLVGGLAEFKEKRKAHCQMHGEYYGIEYVFYTVKPNGRRRSMFAVTDDCDVVVQSAADPDPSQNWGRRDKQHCAAILKATGEPS